MNMKARAMIPFDGNDSKAVAAASRVYKKLRRRLVPIPESSGNVTVSPLTDAFLQDLTEVSLSRFGEDPLAAFNTQIALLSAHPFTCEVDLVEKIIFISDTFVEALEFAAAQASLINIVNRIRKLLTETSNDPHGLLDGINKSRNALHSMYMTRMLLHIIGEKSAPAIAKVLPKEYKLFVHTQLVAATIFALLHEQAHLEIEAGRFIPELTVDLKNAFVNMKLTEDQKEEYASDLWAARQIKKARRGSFIRAASFFFFNQWVVDYLLHNEQSHHPPAFNRIQHMMQAMPDMRQEDIAFFTIMTEGLNQQHQLRKALNVKDRSERYSSLLRYSRAGGAYQHYEDIAEVLSRTFEELGLAKPIM